MSAVPFTYPLFIHSYTQVIHGYSPLLHTLTHIKFLAPNTSNPHLIKLRTRVRDISIYLAMSVVVGRLWL